MTIIKHKRGSADDWTLANTILADGELGFEEDTNKFKIGYNNTAWDDLEYFLPSSLVAGVDDVTTAVQNYVTSTLLTNSLVSQLSAESGYVYAVVDASGRLGAGLTADGYWVANYILKPGNVTFNTLDADMTSRMLASGLGAAFATLAPESGYLFAITDASNHVGFGIKADGSLVGSFATNIADGSITFSKMDTTMQGRVMSYPLAVEAGYPFSIVDAAGHMALGVKIDSSIDTPGGVSYAKYADVAGNASIPVKDSVIETKLDSGGVNRQLYRVKKAGGTRTQLTSANDNFEPRITQDDVVLFRQIVSGVTSDKSVSLAGGTIYAMCSLLDSIRCFGDSLTAGVGGTAYPTQLATLLTSKGIPTSNYGIGGQTSPQIASRQGGNNQLLSVAVTIPADTSSVALTISVDILFQSGNTALTRTASIAGIVGTLSRAAGTFATTGLYSFARTTAGSSTVAPINTPIILQSASDSEQSVQIFFPGRNDLSLGQNMNQTTIAIDQMIAYMKPYAKKYVVLGVTGAVTEITGSANRIKMDAINTINATKYGDSFLDINRYLITNFASIMATAGLTPTSQDATDLANDVIPTSLHYTDGLHFNTTGYGGIAKAVFDFITSKGWLL